MNLESTQVLYIAYGGIMQNVFDSQVLQYVKCLRERNVGITLIVFDQFNKIFLKEYFQKRKKIKEDLGEHVYCMFRLPLMGRFSVQIDAFRLHLYFKKHFQSKYKKIIFHCRNLWASYLALKSIKNKENIFHVLADIRGDQIAEYRCYYPDSLLTRWKIKELQLVGHYTCKHVTKLFCVSSVLAETLEKKYCINTDDIIVVPTCVDHRIYSSNYDSRKALRKKLGIADKFVIVYNGGLQGWQNFEGLIQIATKISQIDSTTFFFVLTKDVSTAKTYLEKHSFPKEQYKVMNLQYGKMAKFLSCGDLGLLVRKQNDVNKVASPTKFAEYLACGMPVLVSPNIGDTESIIKNENVGFVLGNDLQLAALLKRIKDDREALAADCMKVAMKYYDLETYLDQIQNIYDSI